MATVVLTCERESLTNSLRVHERCCHLRYSCDLLSRVHQSSLCAPDVSPALPYPISSEHQSSLRLKCCFVITPLPRLSMYLFHVREVCTPSICIPGKPTARPIPSHAVPQYSTTTRPHTATSHVSSRMCCKV